MHEIVKALNVQITHLDWHLHFERTINYCIQHMWRDASGGCQVSHESTVQQ